MGIVAIALTVDVVVTTLCLYIATRKNWVSASFKELMLIIVVTSVLSLIPRFGWPIGVVSFVGLLMLIAGLSLNTSVLIALITKGLSLSIFLGVALVFS